MTPLEAARKIKDRGCGETSDRWMGTSCYFCDAVLHSGGDIWPATGHTADCPWLAVPQIVAALEATQALVDAHAQFGLWRVVDDPKELGDRQQAALTALWDLGIKPVEPMQSALEG